MVCLFPEFCAASGQGSHSQKMLGGRRRNQIGARIIPTVTPTMAARCRTLRGRAATVEPSCPEAAQRVLDGLATVGSSVGSTIESPRSATVGSSVGSTIESPRSATVRVVGVGRSSLPAGYLNEETANATMVRLGRAKAGGADFLT